ncbi:MAG: DNA-3-methyladenine glycosylase 2 family protein [Hyphomicrobiales bacterium]|nr:DNA-3-methyladenine glycosylase 2 family protein [Hyphomicrobiales bacterium]MDE2114364.1 DNA-3-methyladenine glycosylase 2 family protein [Hyphomicrobiales bacterium]
MHRIDCEDALEQAFVQLKALDPELIGMMHDRAGPPPLRQRAPGFAGMVAIIVSQQVSVASARSIFARVSARFDPLEASAIADASEADLRQCGLSSPKIKCLRALCDAILHDKLDLATLGDMEADAAHDRLTQIKGIGPWTAHIFLLFCLGHPDAWPSGDLALQEGVRMALDLPERPNAKALEVISQRWHPWRGVAARLVWAYYGAVKSGTEFAAMAQAPDN